MHKQQKTEVEDEGAVIWWNCGSPLYDAFEVAWLGHLIERHTRTFPSSSCVSEPFSDKPLISRSISVDKDPSGVVEDEHVAGHDRYFGFVELQRSKYTRKRRISEEKTQKASKFKKRLRSFWIRLVCAKTTK